MRRRSHIPALLAARTPLCAQMRPRFLREAQALGALKHPHIVTVRGFEEMESGQPFLVMGGFEHTMKHKPSCK